MCDNDTGELISLGDDELEMVADVTLTLSNGLTDATCVRNHENAGRGSEAHRREHQFLIGANRASQLATAVASFRSGPRAKVQPAATCTQRGSARVLHRWQMFMVKPIGF